MKHRVTIVEALVAVVIVLAVGGLFWAQQAEAHTRAQDASRKRDINALYYYLEDVYYPQHRGYPATLNPNELQGLNLATLKDPGGRLVNAKNGDYTYEPSGCSANVCSNYKLSAQLQDEATFSKTSQPRTDQ